jgi:hypothetical protein
MSEAKDVNVVWLVLAVVLFGAVILWGYLDENHYFYHDKKARILSKIWDGAAKQCDSLNVKTPQPVLECDNGHSDVQDVAAVRFYGDTRVEGAPDTERLHWKCEKRQSAQPAITCRTSPAN